MLQRATRSPHSYFSLPYLPSLDSSLASNSCRRLLPGMCCGGAASLIIPAYVTGGTAGPCRGRVIVGSGRSPLSRRRGVCVWRIARGHGCDCQSMSWGRCVVTSCRYASAVLTLAPLLHQQTSSLDAFAYGTLLGLGVCIIDPCKTCDPNRTRGKESRRLPSVACTQRWHLPISNSHNGAGLMIRRFVPPQGDNVCIFKKTL
jgi:hypothetical protein